MKVSKELSHAVIGAAMRVHSHFGPGYLEEVYKNALMVELRESGISAEKEVQFKHKYRTYTPSSQSLANPVNPVNPV